MTSSLSSTCKNFFCNVLERTAMGGTQMAEAISANCPDASVYADPGKNHSFVGFGFNSRGIPEFNEGTFCKGKKSIRLYRTGYLMYGPTT